MKTNKKKTLLGAIGLGLGVILLSSCTANFCSSVDQAAMAYPYDLGVTVYLSKTEYDALKNGEDTKDLIAKEETWSAEAIALGLPTIAGPAFVDDAGNPLNDNVYKYVPFTGTGDLTVFNANKTKGFLTDFLTNASKGGYSLPSAYYYSVIDDYTLKAATTQFLTGGYLAPASYKTLVLDNAENVAKLATFKVGDEADFDPNAGHVAVNPYRETDPAEAPTEIPTANSVLRQAGYLKFTGMDGEFLGNYKSWNEEIRGLTKKGFAQLGIFDVPSADFMEYYRTQITAKVSTIRSCIATRDGYFGHYGTYADWRVAIQQKDWGYAWGKGFLEGLLVYPVTWCLDSLAYSFDPALTGVGQIWALIIVTLVVRGLLLAVSWRSTMDNQRMQALQPELAKLQNKYPNANTNQAEKQRLSQEQMALYRRHGIKPFRQILLMFVQFPVFICVWAGLQGSAALSTGEFLNMRLSDNINTILFNTSGTWYQNTHGWWTALILFILMAATQIFAMILPRIIAKKRAKNVVKTSKNPAADQQGRTMKWVSYGLIIFTIVMGFFLPSAMGIYWLIGGLISVIQTIITQIVIGKAPKKGKK